MNKPQIDQDGNKRWYNEQSQLHREDGPAVEWVNGTKSWYQYGQRHRDDGPAIEWVNGAKFWYQHNLLHREDGHAVEHVNGDKEWWFSGKRLHINSQEEFERYMKLKAFW